MSNKVIAISREFGSGGREIGEKLAERLGVPFHDKNIVEHMVKEKGYCKDIVEHFDEKKSYNLMFSLAMNSYGNWYANEDYRPLQAAILEAQAHVIRDFAKKPCVIIGRAADSILGRENCVSVFITADSENRIARIMQRHQCDAKDAERMMTGTDKDRARFHQYYSEKKWGNAASYDLTVDSSRLGIDKSVDLILSYLKLLGE